MKIHQLDQLAQDLWDGLEDDVRFLQAALAGPTPMGTKKLTAAEQGKNLIKMTPMELANILPQLPEESSVYTQALKQLGGHGVALLPYLQPGLLGPANAVSPTSGTRGQLQGDDDLMQMLMQGGL